MAKYFKCSSCPSLVVKLNEEGCNPSCCGKPMEEMNPNTVDAAKEKHVPVVEVKGNVVNVVVGDVLHPMLDVHYIVYIALETNLGVSIHYLKPGQEPRASFALTEGEIPSAVLAYCNLHGLWKAAL